MNWRLGFRRISAVAWGLLAAFAAIALFAIVHDEARIHGWAQALGYAVAVGGFVLGLIVLGHRGTCWIIDGFFAPK